MRSNRGVVATYFLNNFGDFFINHGGHDCAAGFSFETKKLPEFLSKLKNLLQNINLEDEKTEYKIDANIPPSYLNPEIFKLIDIFEPYGNENPELVLKTEGFDIYEATEVGKKDPTHLKLCFANNNFKFPAMFWGQGELLKNYIKNSQNCDILYSLNKNYFNGMVTNQFILKDLQL
jgi:single-stranded-DNA-specific exonuclease